MILCITIQGTQEGAYWRAWQNPFSVANHFSTAPAGGPGPKDPMRSFLEGSLGMFCRVLFPDSGPLALTCLRHVQSQSSDHTSQLHAGTVESSEWTASGRVPRTTEPRQRSFPERCWWVCISVDPGWQIGLRLFTRQSVKFSWVMEPSCSLQSLPGICS